MKPVSIIITAYSMDSKAYLDLCVKSIKNLDYPGEIEVIIVGKPDYAPMYEGCETIYPPFPQFYPPVGLNFGMNHAKHDLMLVLNDDTILTKNSLKKLVETYSQLPHIGLLMPISNDQQGRYSAMVGVQPGPMKLESLERPEEIMNWDSCYPLALSYHETLCIYAFMISKRVYEAVGPFDEALVNSDDLDYTMRMNQHGYANAIAYNAIIYHFGGITADKTFTPEIREEGRQRFVTKWSGAQSV